MLPLVVLVSFAVTQEPEWPRAAAVDAQPLAVHVERLVEALDHLGAPPSQGTRRRLEQALACEEDADVVRGVEEALDPLCLVGLSINPESRVKAVGGPAARELVEQGWSIFLVKVANSAGVTAPLGVFAPQAAPLPGSPPEEVRDRWLEIVPFDSRPLEPTLSGAGLEYRILQLHSRDAGKRSAVVSFDVGQGRQEVGFRNDVVLTFDCRPSTPVTLEVRDEEGRPVMASFDIRDGRGLVYPSPAKRLAPDFAFQPQVYRAHGEEVRLPPGTYDFVVRRGPETRVIRRRVEVGAEPAKVAFELERWIDPAARGWWSGDHHIHAAGCMHYADPTQGVHPADMIRHIRGEDLKVGAALTWGPCFDYQKQFFSGGVDEASVHPYLLRYDIEVSGFGSHQSGHLVLLRLHDQIYPGGESKGHWPTLGLNTLRWAKAQGAVCGPAHSGLGLAVSNHEVPSYEVPPFNGIGANEYVMDVTHEVPGPDGELVPAVDFMSTMDTEPAFELTIWYHTLNCGFRTRISGETDFPCLFGSRVGLGRSYVALDGPLDYDAWCEGIRAGRAYVSDGFSHLMDFRVGDVEVGRGGSELRLDRPGRTSVRVLAAALLPERAIDTRHLPPWNVERARIPGTRDVAVECVVNGHPVAQKVLKADGTQRELGFEVELERSSWIALRIPSSSHTNPVFVVVDGAPIRASRRSARWCQESLERCWSQKRRFYAAGEREQAQADYAHARRAYERILAECAVD